MLHPILAYIDPGSGSLIIQALIATLVAVPILLRGKIADLVRAVRRDKATTETADDGPAGG